jgi:hypothetical protein
LGPLGASLIIETPGIQLRNLEKQSTLNKAHCCFWTANGHLISSNFGINKAKMRAPLSALCFVVMAAVVLADVSEAPTLAPHHNVMAPLRPCSVPLCRGLQE